MALEALQQHFRTEQETLWGDGLALSAGADGVSGHFARLRLHSHFQPLLDAVTLQPLAHEALLRPLDPDSGAYLPPSAAFACARTPQEAVYLDRLCRVVHALNFVRQQPGRQLLFLNVSGRHLAAVAQEHGAAFERLLALCGLQPQQVVLEILEASVDQLELLQTALQAYRKRGFRIAMDDFGCQHSNFDRLWQLTPDLVKLDRHLIQQAEVNPRAADPAQADRDHPRPRRPVGVRGNRDGAAAPPLRGRRQRPAAGLLLCPSAADAAARRCRNACGVAPGGAGIGTAIRLRRRARPERQKARRERTRRAFCLFADLDVTAGRRRSGRTRHRR